MLEGSGRVIQAGSGGMAVYVSTDVTADSQFPFKQGDRVKVRIEKGKLIVERVR